MDKAEVIVYTDGSCWPNPGPGGWAALLTCEGEIKEISGSALSTTNNRMEMMAAIEAIKLLVVPCRVILYTDSQYLRNGITLWVSNWRMSKWHTRTGEDVKNRDLWEELDRLCQQQEVEWRWIKGHQGNEGNERVDELSLEARLLATQKGETNEILSRL